MKKTMISIPKIEEEIPTVFFDQNCGLCNLSVNFLKNKSKEKSINFLPLDSPEGKKILKKGESKNIDGKLENIDGSSVVLLKSNELFFRSDAIIQVAFLLKFPWKLLFLAKIVPKSIRDFFYNLIAKNRKRISCLLRLEKPPKRSNATSRRKKSRPLKKP